MKTQLPMQFRSATITPDTTDSAKRTFNVVWSTGAAVKRFDPLENRIFNEVLDLSGADLSRLNSGAAPVLDGHQAAGVGSVIGVVERASISAGKGVATIRLSERPFVQSILQDVQDGILRNVSIGYSIDEATLIPGKNGQPDTVKVVRFTPLEISLVSIPADAGAQVQRSQDKTFPVQLTRQLFDAAAIYAKRNATRGAGSALPANPPGAPKPTPPARRALPDPSAVYASRRSS
ncbi:MULTISPECIES: HK97 family phage prohead protease [unclassified Methylococcus]|uniref:HK97 family phage prohead protease n=1 Tax=unclassified Methylococcus TaxID=2618889 RepID=UPI003D7E146F